VVARHLLRGGIFQVGWRGGHVWGIFVSPFLFTLEAFSIACKWATERFEYESVGHCVQIWIVLAILIPLSRFQPLLVRFRRGNPGRAVVIGHMLSFNLGLPGSARLRLRWNALFVNAA
jgi:hypothetical protein